MKQPLRVMWLGLRGFPDVQGGVEAHAEHLCPRLVELGCEVTVIVRSRYQQRSSGNGWHGVRFVRLWSPRSSRLEAVVHSLAGVLYAAMTRPDILHIQGIGPSLMTPLARMLGLRVVVTHHGPDYERQKWGKLARSVLRLGERWGMAFANQRIVITAGIHQAVMRTFGEASVIIPNGVELADKEIGTETPNAFGLTPGNYALLVGRLVPEKRHHDLINAFQKAFLSNWKLVIVGGADHPDAYAQSVMEASNIYADVICTGFLTGNALSELYHHAGVFVLPSSHEGLPIAMLEAISHGVPVIASDIPANREVPSTMVSHYPLGDLEALAACMRQAAENRVSNAMREAGIALISSKYSWTDIARQTLGVYAVTLGPAANAPATPADERKPTHGQDAMLTSGMAKTTQDEST